MFNTMECTSVVSDSESCVSGSEMFTSGGLALLDEPEDRAHGVIKHRFLSCLGHQLANRTSVVAIHRRDCSSTFSAQAKAQAFQVHHRFMGLGADPNLKFAWFGCDRRAVDRIVHHGFGLPDLARNHDGGFGRGVCLSASDSPFHSVQSADVDEEGLRHVVLCRVLLGKVEVVDPGSEQTHPSSEGFTSGVDSVDSPTKYIVWSTHMNTHILPEYVVSLRAPLSLRSDHGERVKKPNSPWLPFPALIQELAKFLPSNSVQLIAKYHKQHKEGRISRNQLIQFVRQQTGDMLLMSVIKSWRAKNPRAGFKKAKLRF